MTLKFMRNKLTGIVHRDQETLRVYGTLDDDIYGLQLEVTIGLCDMVILSIEGRFNRWTTPECPKAVPALQNAVGLRIQAEGFPRKVQKSIGRGGCLHFANLLLECCATARGAVQFTGRKRPGDERGGETPGFTAVEIRKGTDEGSGQEQEVLHRASPEGGIIIDLHVHTSPASSCSVASVHEVVSEAKRIGLGGICLTDHNTLWDPDEIEALRQKYGFLVLRGNEITTDQGDVIVFGLDVDMKGVVQLRELREMVLKAEGFMIVAHPFRGFLTFGVDQLGLTPEKAMERPLFKGVDAVEVLNGRVTEKENALAAEVARGLGLLGTGGSDAHQIAEVGLYATRFPADITNEADLVEALRSGNCFPVAFRRGPGLR
ncbi:MAG: CehA/McbA family metallohydrolase [Desulfobacterales bacterium]|nr:CehA/McbA family metallohydrolase [Desulfobacterales bacterium]